MRIRTVVPWVALLGITAILGSRAVSQEPGGGPGMKMDPEQMQKAMEEYMKLGQPGEAHKCLEYMIGKWDTVMKMYMAGPDGPSTESKGTTENKWVLDGRFVQSHAESMMEMPNPADPKNPMKMPFKGMGLFGYDNFRNVYTGTWADSMGTQLLTFKGARDPKTGDIVYYGEMDEPYVPGVGRLVGRYVRYVTRVISKDKHVMECYDLYAGENHKAFEITYTRQR